MWLKPRQVGAERVEREEILRWLWQFYRAGWINLYFGDESAFSMKGETSLWVVAKGRADQDFSAKR